MVSDPSQIRRAVAPYRLSPLGAHTDHQNGLTCGFALDRRLTIEFRASGSSEVRLESRDFPGKIVFDVKSVPPATGDWGDYVRGVALVLGRRFPLQNGIEGRVSGELPPGGISSSAALQVAFMLALLDANGLRLEREAGMALVVEAERTYSGVSVGLLDPAVILFGRERGLVFLDCREGAPRLHSIPERAPPFEFLLLDSGLRRDLRDSPYNQRVEECRRAAVQAGACGARPVLRDVDAEAFRRARSRVDPDAARRADHFFAENKRVRSGLQALAAGDMVSFGSLMSASAESLTRLYGCGTPETQELLRLLSLQSGVLGASYAGGGFGGMVQALVRPGTADLMEAEVLQPYRDLHPACGAGAQAFNVGIGAGAHVA